MNVIDVEFLPGGIGLVFDDSTSADGKFEIIGGNLELVGFTPAQLVALQAFDNNIDSSVIAYDPRFGSGVGTGIYSVVEDTTPQIGRQLDLNGFSVYGGPDVGDKAFDFQLTRTLTTQIVSTTYGFASGRNNMVSGTGGYVEGDGNIVSGAFAYAEGASNQSIRGYAHSEGHNNIASGIASHVEGENNIASGDYSHAEGYNTVASGAASHSEGSYTTASGDYSLACGGSTVAAGEASLSSGIGSVASLHCQLAHASGVFEQIGDAQHTETLFRLTTLDTDWNELLLDGDGGTEYYNLDSQCLYLIRVAIAGFREGSNECCFFMRSIQIEMGVGTAIQLSESVIGTDINTGYGTFDHFSVRFSATDSTDGSRFSIEVKYDNGGDSAGVIWMATADALQTLSTAGTS